MSLPVEFLRAVRSAIVEPLLADVPERGNRTMVSEAILVIARGLSADDMRRLAENLGALALEVEALCPADGEAS